RWKVNDVLDLFDSIYRGFPIGSLLLFRRRGPAARVTIGPLTIDAPEREEAWWVVDGQQRLTTLAAALARPEPIPSRPEDPYVVYFDPRERRFYNPPRDGQLPDSWIPLPVLLDATRLGEYLQGRADRELSRRSYDAGKRIREYKVPLYLIGSADEADGGDLIKEVFYRTNKTGKALKWDEVYDALYGHQGGQPSTVSQLVVELRKLGMGGLSKEQIMPCLLAVRGLDVTRSLAEHRRRDPQALRGAVPEALPILRKVLSFLKSHAAMPHVRLLPRTWVIEVLARFFALHPDPRERSLDLLSRWVWRFLTGEDFDERTLRRHGVEAIKQNDEERSVQDLLRLAPPKQAAPVLPDAFDARAARSRLALLALASLGPRSLQDGSIIDVGALIEEVDVEAFRTAIPARRGGPALARSPANRLIHPGSGAAKSLIIARAQLGIANDPVLTSHAVGSDATHLLSEGRAAEFLELRKKEMLRIMEIVFTRLRGEERRDRDRPTIDYLIASTGGGP